MKDDRHERQLQPDLQDSSNEMSERLMFEVTITSKGRSRAALRSTVIAALVLLTDVTLRSDVRRAN